VQERQKFERIGMIRRDSSGRWECRFVGGRCIY